MDSDTFFISIGDDEVQKCKVTTTNGCIDINFITKFSNYDSQREHSDMCNSCFTIMSQHALLLTYFVEQNPDLLQFDKVKTLVKVTYII